VTPAKYSSRLRAEQAAQTRQRVLAAAAELFAADGFARTTLARLAEAAGVSVETVQAQGSKRSLLTAAVHQLTFGNDSQEDLSSAPQARATIEAASPEEFCERGAHLAAGFNAQTFRLWRAFSSAAADDPNVDQELTALSAFIRGQCREIVAMLADRHWLRHDVGVDELGDSLWVLVGAENYDKITTRLGWSHQRYETWLTRSLSDLLFRRDTGTSGTGP
jgi:AcrR family transcriptional regulator